MYICLYLYKSIDIYGYIYLSIKFIHIYIYLMCNVYIHEKYEKYRHKYSLRP